MDKSIAGPFFTWQFLAVAIAVQACMTAFNRTCKVYKPLGKVAAKGWFQGLVMTPLNIVLGALFATVAIPKGWLTPEDIKARLILGICAGFLSLFAYTMFKKRVEILVGVSSGSNGAADKPADTEPPKEDAKPGTETDTKPDDTGGVSAGEEKKGGEG